MNLKHLTDACLLSETKRLVREERELLTTILHHLREIDRRRLYTKYLSINAYAIEELKYSKDQAWRRVEAMRLMTEMPEIEEQIESGALNLTHVGLAQALFKQEHAGGQAFDTEKKRQVIQEMAGRTTREAEGVAYSHATNPPKFRESIKGLGNGRSILTIEVSDELLADLEKLKGLLAHKNPSISTGELIERIAKIALDQLDPAKPPQRKTSAFSRAAIRRQVWVRDGGACTNCGSNHAVEIDHIQPVAMGGGDTLENLRLLCRGCNQWAAIEKLGLEKMERYFRNAAG